MSILRYAMVTFCWGTYLPWRAFHSLCSSLLLVHLSGGLLVLVLYEGLLCGEKMKNFTDWHDKSFFKSLRVKNRKFENFSPKFCQHQTAVIVSFYTWKLLFICLSQQKVKENRTNGSCNSSSTTHYFQPKPIHNNSYNQGRTYRGPAA